MKYKYYIGILGEDNTVQFVTSIDRDTKCAYWTKGEKAMTFTKTTADDYAFGLIVNGYCASVIKLPAFYEPMNVGDAS